MLLVREALAYPEVQTLIPDTATRSSVVALRGMALAPRKGRRITHAAEIAGSLRTIS
jgi:hypothetical protein